MAGPIRSRLRPARPGGLTSPDPVTARATAPAPPGRTPPLTPSREPGQAAEPVSGKQNTPEKTARSRPPDRITGKLDKQGESTVQMHGILVLHGSEHELTVPVQANIAGDHWTGSSKFSVPFVEWGLKNPSTWLLKVEHSVMIDLELKGAVQGPAAQ